MGRRSFSHHGQKRLMELEKGSEYALLSAVYDTCNRHGLFLPNDSVLAGVSGGADSVALFCALNRLKDRWPITVDIAHVNHMLRGKAADADEEFVRELADRYGVKIYSAKIDVNAVKKARKISLEDAGRQVRRNFLIRTARENGYDRIALGHHAGDNAETVLLHFLRGTGPAGLSGMNVKAGRVVRPLMFVHRVDIETFLGILNESFCQDESNQDLVFTRNRIRNELLPHLSERYNPNIISSLNKLSRLSSDDEDWWNERMPSLAAQCGIVEDSGKVSLDIFSLDGLHIAESRRLVRWVLLRLCGTLQRFELGHVESVLSLCKTKTNGSEVHLPGGIVVGIYEETVTFSRQKRGFSGRPISSDLNSFPPQVIKKVEGPGTKVFPEAGIRLEFDMIETDSMLPYDQLDRTQVYFDEALLKFPLILRFWRPGDRFTPLGMNGSQKVKKFLSDRKISMQKRRKVVVLESQGNIVWIVGWRMAHEFRVGPETGKVFSAKVLLA